VTETEITKIIFAQAVITVFAVLLGYVKLSQEIRKSNSQKVYDMQLDLLRRQLSEFYGPLSTCFRVLRLNWRRPRGAQIFGKRCGERLWCLLICRSNPSFIEDRFARRARYSKILLDFIKHSQFNRAYIAMEGYGGLSYFEKLVPYPADSILMFTSRMNENVGSIVSC
jgi:hypothetical protein